MKNFKHNGDLVTVAAPAAVSSGDGVLVGNLFGVATTDAESGADVVIATRGVFELPKLGTDVVSQGDTLYWDDTNGELTLATTGNYPVGVAVKAAGNGDTTVEIRLDGVATAAAA